MNNGVVYLEPGEECRFVMSTSSPDGSYIDKTSVDVRVNLIPKVSEEPRKLFGFIGCPHCGYVYVHDRGIHSVVTKVQPDTIFKPFGQKYSAVYYDAWDCPKCGGQFVGSERAPRCK